MCCPQEPWLQYSGEASYPPSSSLQSSGAGEIILSPRNLVSSVIKSPISRSSVQQVGSTNHLPDAGGRESSQRQWKLCCYPWAVWSLMLTHSPGLFIRAFWPGQVLFYCAHFRTRNWDQGKQPCSRSCRIESRATWKGLSWFLSWCSDEPFLSSCTLSLL